MIRLPTAQTTTLKVDDKIELNEDDTWIPATVKKIFPDGSLGFFMAELETPMRFRQVMTGLEDIAWRRPDAAVSA